MFSISMFDVSSFFSFLCNTAFRRAFVRKAHVGIFCYEAHVFNCIYNHPTIQTKSSQKRSFLNSSLPKLA